MCVALSLNSSSQRLQLKSCLLATMAVVCSLSLSEFLNYAQCDFLLTLPSLFLVLSYALFPPLQVSAGKLQRDAFPHLHPRCPAASRATSSIASHSCIFLNQKIVVRRLALLREKKSVPSMSYSFSVIYIKYTFKTLH